MSYEKNVSGKIRAYAKNNKLVENRGQDEGRQQTVTDAIAELQKYFPDIEITEENYNEHLTLWLRPQRKNK